MLYVKKKKKKKEKRRGNTALCDIPRCEGGGVAEGVRSEKQEKVMGSATGGTGVGGAHAEGGAGKRGSRMTPWPGTYRAFRLLGPTPDSQLLPEG